MSRNAAAYFRSPGAVSTIVKQWRPPAPAPGPLASTSRAAALHQIAHHGPYPSSSSAAAVSAASQSILDPTLFAGVGDGATAEGGSVFAASSAQSSSSSSSAHGPVPRTFTSVVGGHALPIDPLPPTASTSSPKPFQVAPTSALTDLSARSLPLFFVGRSSVRSAAARVVTPPVSRPSYVFSPGAAGLPKQRVRRGVEAAANPPSTWDTALVRGGTIGGERWTAEPRDADNLSVQVGEDAFFLRTVRPMRACGLS